MSAIAGLYSLDGPTIDNTDLRRMVESLAHRGPDGSLWRNGSIALGHRMLLTTPESVDERLPLVNGTNHLALTADARIDNREDLIARLHPAGRLREPVTDSALILQAYETWGDGCPDKLVGDFAFALWDGRKQILFCARDAMGVKPFYYYHCANRLFAFASEIKALLCLPQVPRRLNEIRVADYLVSCLEDKAITFYQHIFRLPPGHCMTVSPEGVSARPYWALDPSYELRLGSDDEYAEAFREVFIQAVRCRLRSQFPIGAMLSGGLDSSSICCTARRLWETNGTRRLYTVSATFDDVPACDERPFIRAVLDQGGYEPAYVRADQLSPLTDLDRVLWHEDEAFYAPNLFIHWGLYRGAHRQGVRVLLDGLDGDTTVSHGLPRLIELACRGRWLTLVSEANGLSSLLNAPLPRVVWHQVIRPLMPNPGRRPWGGLRRGSGQSIIARSAINRDFARRIGLEERIKAYQARRITPAHAAREDHLRRLSSGVVPFVLEVADRAAAAFGIEPRYPFFDRRLVSFCLSLPSEQKLQQGWTRAVMRRAMANILPETVRLRKSKSDLSANFNRGLLAFARPCVEDVILNDSRAIEPYVDLTLLRDTYHRFVSKGAHDDALVGWKTVTLGLWLHRTNLSP